MSLTPIFWDLHPFKYRPSIWRILVRMKSLLALGLLIIALVAAIGIIGLSIDAPAKKQFAKPAAAAAPGSDRLEPGFVAGTDDHASERRPRSVPDNKVISHFRALATCAKYRRISEFMESMAKDPFSWVNNDEARADLPPGSLEHIEGQIEFLESHSGQCTTELASGEFQEDIYHAALAAARAGDREAAICFVLAIWPHSVRQARGPIVIGHGGAASPAIRKPYLANVHDLVQVGREAGDWNMVAVALGTHGSMGHGLTAEAMPHDPVKAYGYQWLQKLGARGDLAKEADRGLELLASRISPQDIARQQRWAAGVYARHFSASPEVASGGAVCPW